VGAARRQVEERAGEQVRGRLTSRPAARAGRLRRHSNAARRRALSTCRRAAPTRTPWVMAFDSEEEAFRAYAEAQPGNCVLLSTPSRVARGSAAGRPRRAWRSRAARPNGCSASGSTRATSPTCRSRRAASSMKRGCPTRRSCASNDLDEHLIESLRQQGAGSTSGASGRRLVTAFDEPALGGVYKLAGDPPRRRPLGAAAEALRAGRQDHHAGAATGPPLLRRTGPGGRPDLRSGARRRRAADGVDPLDPTRRKRLHGKMEAEDLLVPVLARRRCGLPAAAPRREVHERARAQIARLHPGPSPASSTRTPIRSGSSGRSTRRRWPRC